MHRGQARPRSTIGRSRRLDLLEDSGEVVGTVPLSVIQPRGRETRATPDTALSHGTLAGVLEDPRETAQRQAKDREGGGGSALAGWKGSFVKTPQPNTLEFTLDGIFISV